MITGQVVVDGDVGYVLAIEGRGEFGERLSLAEQVGEEAVDEKDELGLVGE